MPVIYLIICVLVAGILSTTIDSLVNLGALLAPTPWIVGGIALVAVTWLMRD